jgi:hypothetical protein
MGAINVNIYKMPGAFLRHGISALVRIYCMLRYKIDIRLIQQHHLRGQQKYRIVIYFLMSVKAPAIGGVISNDQQKTKENGKDRFSHVQFLRLSKVQNTRDTRVINNLYLYRKFPTRKNPAILFF